MQKLVYLAILTFILSSCNPLGKDDATKDSTQSISNEGTTISEVRDTPSTTPVANYAKKVQNDLNDWNFKVQLYETKKRFVYRMVMEYETINEEKEITFPNLRMEPKPEIRPGSRAYDAIVGFINNKGEFKEFIDVFVQDDNLKVRTLKYYAVSEKEVE